MQIKHYVVTYNPTDDGDREVLSEDEYVITFDDVDELFDWLVDRGIYEPSACPDFQLHMWYSAEPYQSLLSGVWFDETLHRGDGTTDDEWRALYDIIKGEEDG